MQWRLSPFAGAMILPLAGAVQADIFQGEAIDEVEESRWQSEIEYGLVVTTGNTDTESSSGSLVVVHEAPKWRQRTALRTLRSADEGVVTAERHTASYKVDYKFRPKDYAFFAMRYEDDRFSGLDYRVSEAVGYGRRIVEGERVRLDAEVGAGMIHERPEGGDRSDEEMGRLAADLRWIITEGARFSQTVLVERSNATYAESDTGLTTTVGGNLSMRVSYQVRYNSEVPPETEKTDTMLGVNLVYSF